MHGHWPELGLGAEGGLGLVRGVHSWMGVEGRERDNLGSVQTRI